MPTLAPWLQKPEYFFRPSQILRRLRGRGADRAETAVRLPCGLDLSVNADEAVGRAICRLGVYDLPVSETVWRLLAPGDRALDAGANLGYMSALMAARVGPAGQVLSFEPHPVVYRRLRTNVERWPRGRCAAVQAVEVALSEREETGRLFIPQDFAGNQGTARVAEAEEDGVSIRCVRLDSLAGAGHYQLMKMDVEGHELSALTGAGELITQRRIAHILFEEMETYPAPTAVFLERCGYTIFSLGLSFWGPRLELPQRAPTHQRAWLPPSLVATLEPAGLQRALGPRGWRVLRGH